MAQIQGSDPAGAVGVGGILTAGKHRGQGADQFFHPDGSLVQHFFSVNADNRAELDLVGRLLETRTGGHDHLFQGLQFLRLFAGFSFRHFAGFGLRLLSCRLIGIGRAGRYGGEGEE